MKTDKEVIKSELEREMNDLKYYEEKLNESKIKLKNLKKELQNVDVKVVTKNENWNIDYYTMKSNDARTKVSVFKSILKKMEKE